MRAAWFATPLSRPTAPVAPSFTQKSRFRGRQTAVPSRHTPPPGVSSSMSGDLPITSTSGRDLPMAQAPPTTTLPRKVWTVTKTGSLAGLRLDDDVIAAPGPGEVRITVKAVGLNFADVFSVLGLYQATPPTPFVPGLELCGVVESIGVPREDLPSGTVVPTYSVGDAVMAVVRFGGYATCVNAPVHQTRPVPGGWSFEQGAGFLVQGLTAFYALKGLGDVRPGQKVLIHSAAGGCGGFGVGICTAIGAHPIPVVGSDTKKKVLMQRFPEIPTNEIIVRPKKGKLFGAMVKDSVRAIAARLNTPETDMETASACDIVMDATMGDFFKGGWDNLSTGGGRYVVYGAADLTPTGDLSVWDVKGWAKLAFKYLKRPFVDPTNLPGTNKSVMGFNLIWMFHKHVVLGELLHGLLQLNLDAPAVGETFAFADAPKALRRFQSGATTGKCVLTVGEQE